MTNVDSSSNGTHSAGLSKTAIWVAAARAVGAREPDADVRNPDVLAEKLLGDPAKLVLDHPMVDALSLGYDEAMQSIEVADTVRAMSERSRFIDEKLESAIAAGATQVLICGAGLDSRAYRFRDLLAPVSVFEVDRHATLEFKRARVGEAVGDSPENLSYVTVDFQNEALADALARHGYDVSKRTFVIMEGLTMYLPEDDLRTALEFVAAHTAGSSVVFDFASAAIVDSIMRIDLANIPEPARPSIERFVNMIRDEPWLFGFEVDAEKAFLAECGLDVAESLTIGSEESVKRYLTRADGTTVGAETHARAQAMREAIEARGNEQLTAQQREAIAQQRRERQRQMTYRIAEAVVAQR